MKLFLCEKPSQAKDIGKVLGVLDGRFDGYFSKNDVALTWAFGHILEYAMPDAYGEQYKNWGNLDALPIVPQRWLIVVKKEASKQFGVIQKLLKQADEVVIATDADREGEVIGREILDYCGYRGKVFRFWTSGLDPASVKKALAGILPGQKTEPLYQAGLARSRADWLVGMNLSRAYTVAYVAGFGKEHTLSVGRIQTPTLNLVVQRDKIIDTFVPYPYYTLAVSFVPQDKEPFKATWQIPENLRNQDGFCTDKAVVDDLAKRIHGNRYIIDRADTELKKTPAPLPYSLSALQKEASKRFNISTGKVLDIAQALYEKHKLTSYPRTPCQYLPQSQQADVSRIFTALESLDPSISGSLKQADPLRDSRVWNDAQVNKHSHHAIIPTSVAIYDLNTLSKIERDIYLMIRNRYIAQFLPDYQYEATVILITAEQQLFKAMGQVPKQQGWKALLGQTEDHDDDDKGSTPLPKVSAGESVQAAHVYPESKKTTPPPRFTEATLLDEMRTLSDFLKTVGDEAIKKVLKSTEGLGTEATRAAIIGRLFEMKYLDKQKGKISATNKGKHLIAAIPPAVADPITTAKWELALACIEAGRLTLAEFLSFQGASLGELVAQAKADAVKRPPPIAAAKPSKPQAAASQIGQTCPTCQTGTLIRRDLKNNPEKPFLGCSNYPKCKHFEWLKSN
ncbi:DNA topoisomerase 3 [Stenoxybacter acetivorans]|uniref:DNA topoisomerase 3 n=1 Tax=Stenoxybacter acetivorans TaxID=422441 RepID=UPI00068F7D78|nr:DNA topoisomerase 3 [Stenoxybacter acetivorans]